MKHRVNEFVHRAAPVLFARRACHAAGICLCSERGLIFALAAKTLEDAIKEAVQTRQDLKRCKDVMLLGNFDGGSAEIAPFERTEWLLIADCDLNPFWPSYHQLQQ